MNFFLLGRELRVLSMLTLTSLAFAALGAPPADSPYVTDPQNAWVHDATSDGIANLNMVLCIMHAMRPVALVNQGPYLALVDKNKCDSAGQASASNSTAGASGATSAPDYMNAVVDVTRASDSDPMIGKVWMTMQEEGTAFEIYVHLTAAQSPTEAPPYGQFRVDYISRLPDGSVGFNGFVDTDGANVSYLETGQMSNDTALGMTATSTEAGSGTMQVTDPKTLVTTTFNFAYDGSEASFPVGVFRRDDGTHDVCFDRALTQTKKSVWRYGTYNADTGERLDQPNPGFPVVLTYNGATYYGYAGYWGVNFQGFDLNSMSDGTIAGATVTDQRPNNSSTYTLSKVKGKLTKWTQNEETLADMDGVPFSFWGDLTGQTSDTQVTGFDNWQVHWDNTTGKFVVTGAQVCNNGPCVVTELSAPATITGSAFDSSPVPGWSDAFGGNIEIPMPIGAIHTGADPVYFYSQSQVIPGDGDAPAALYCMSNCPTAVSLNDFVNNGAPSPFDTTTAQQWGWGTISVMYSFDSGGLKESSTPMVISDRDVLTGPYLNGVMTGRLFDAPLTHANCPPGAPSGQICEPPQPQVYYTWQSGADQWNQSMWLTRSSDDTVVTFDPPRNISYTVPSGNGYGSWAGKNIQLQFDGFGNLGGIPGNCVSPNDNSQVDCSTPNARYVPAFALPDGATMTLTGSNIPLIVKGLDAEIRLKKIGGCAGVALAQPTSAVILPTVADLHDPTDSTDDDYIGDRPTVTEAPKVIHGVLQ